MNKYDEILTQHLSEQIALEEHLCRIIEEQLAEIDETDFADAKILLKNAGEVLERHFTPLNQLLDKFDQAAVKAKATGGNGTKSNGVGMNSAAEKKATKRLISRILRDDYSALNLITISNTLLHTTALALRSDEVAAIALKHLENLAPLIVKIGDLVPEIVARELRADAPDIDLTVAKTALKNTQSIWKRGC